MGHSAHIGRAQWSSPLSYFLVTGGALIGLANIFEFPSLVFQYGGLFVLLSLACEFAIALPLLLSELMIGRRGKQNPVGAFELLSFEGGRKTYWRWAGWMAFTVAFLTLSYYAVSAAFPTGYFLKSAALAYAGSTTPFSASQLESHLTTKFLGLEIFFIVLLGAVVAVVWRGINRGLEQISRIVVPLYCVIFAALAIYASVFGNFTEALQRLTHFSPDIPFTTIFFSALTFSLFTLSVGMGSIIVYGSYLPYRVSLGRSTFLLTCFDAAVSLTCYFILFPLLFQSHSEALGHALTNFNVILIFTAFPHGLILAAVFFFAVMLAAWMPMIAMAEIVTVTLIERFNLLRRSAVFIVTLVLLALGTFIVACNTTWISAHFLGRLPWNQIVPIITSNILMPLSALMTTIFAGWIIKKSITEAELQLKPALYRAWLFSVRYLAPLLIVIILIWNLTTHSYILI